MWTIVESWVGLWEFTVIFFFSFCVFEHFCNKLQGRTLRDGVPSAGSCNPKVECSWGDSDTHQFCGHCLLRARVWALQRWLLGDWNAVPLGKWAHLPWEYAEWGVQLFRPHWLWQSDFWVYVSWMQGVGKTLLISSGPCIIWTLLTMCHDNRALWFSKKVSEQ